MKYLLMLLLLIGCDDARINEPEAEDEKPNVYIVAGQSNAQGCDWSYFEDLTKSEVIMIALPGKRIEQLIDLFPDKEHLIKGVNAKAILFVHGESDAIAKTTNYIEQVEEYRVMLGDFPIFISNVGYFGKYPKELFDTIINQVKAEAEFNENWFIAFDQARYFLEWGMLKADNGHFNKDGCIMMMDAFAEQTYK